MRNHNIVADGWAGVSNSPPEPPPTHAHTKLTAVFKMRIFLVFNLRVTDRHMDGRTNRPTDGRMDGWIDGRKARRTETLIEMRVRNQNISLHLH